jgi:hypothetical protein
LLANHGRENAVIQVRSAVPDAVGLANRDVVHLHREVMVEAVLPDVGVSIGGDGKGRRALIGVFDDIEAGILDRGEVEFRIYVAQPGRGRRNRALKDLLVRSFLGQA